MKIFFLTFFFFIATGVQVTQSVKGKGPAGKGPSNPD